MKPRLSIHAGIPVLALAIAFPLAAHAAPVSAMVTSPQLVVALESKWSGVMRKIRNWDEAAMRQFHDGYASYPASVLQQALDAPTFEEMTSILDAHARTQAQVAMAKAYPFNATLPEDADDPQVASAKTLAAKTLGDDARDLVFIPVTPCTVWDTRFATNAASMGVIADGATKRFYSHLDGAGGSYAAYGGNPSCPETSQNALGNRPFAVMMTVYLNDATSNGWLTFYRDGDADPSQATISAYYSPGPTRTQTVISKSSRGYGTGTYDVAVTGRFGTANGSASVVGYFLKAVVPAAPPPSIVSTQFFGGAVGNIAASSPNLLFVGPTTVITTTATQRITGHAAIDLGVASGGPFNAETDFCYRTNGTVGAPLNMASLDYLHPQVFGVRLSYPINGTVVPGAGTWEVGACVHNGTATIFNNNGWVNGTLQVTN